MHENHSSFTTTTHGLSATQKAPLTYQWEICELVGLFILNSLQQLFGKDVDLYRDDGLAVLNTKSGRLCEKARKDLILKFDELGLRITALANRKAQIFLT